MTTAWQCMVLDCALGRGPAAYYYWDRQVDQCVWAVCAVSHMSPAVPVATHSAAERPFVGTGFWPQWRRCNGQCGRPVNTRAEVAERPASPHPKSTSDGSGDFSMKRKTKNILVFWFVFFLISVIERNQTACVSWGVVVWEFYHVCPSQETIAIIKVTNICCSSCLLGPLCFLYPRFCHLLLLL